MKLIQKFCLALMIIWSVQAHAVVDVTVNRGTVEPTPIAIPAFFTRSGSQEAMAQEMLEVIERDLAFSGFFSPLDDGIFMQTAKEVIENPRYNDWRLIQAQIVLAGELKPLSSGKVKAEAYLQDPYSEKLLMKIDFDFKASNWRHAAHKISDMVYERVTGERGYFNTKIVYISDSGTAIEPEKRLAIMDQDGANVSYLTDGLAITMSPRFSPDGKLVTFLSYRDGRPKVYLMNLETKSVKPLVEAKGMTFAPRFSPDSKKVVYSISKYGNSNIFEMDLKSNKTKRLTSGYHIDTSPSYSPDGKMIAFESDRGGYQNIYVMSLDSGRTERISFGGGSHSTPVWSPKGNLIAFTRIKQGQFAIGVMRPNGDGKRIIVEDFHVEAPDWSPNGRRLIYFRETRPRDGQLRRNSKLYTIDLTGYDEQLVPTYDNASDPAWSL